VARGGWLFKRDVVSWLSDPELRDQLPPAYRAFGRYCSLYFRAFGDSQRLVAGRVLFRIACWLHRSTSGEPLGRIEIGSRTLYYDLEDPRFLQVVNEVDGRGDSALLGSLLGEGDTFVDVGANHGGFSIVASHLVGPSGRVVAVEPQPRLAEAIRRSLAANGSCTHEVHEFAVSDRDGEIDLLIPTRSSGRAGAFQTHSGRRDHRTVRVAMRRFDEAVDWGSFGKGTVVKLDVEGSELSFLKGARRMLETLQPRLLMEVNAVSMQAAGTDLRTLTDLLGEIGYRHYLELDALVVPRPLSDLRAAGARSVLFVRAPLQDGESRSSPGTHDPDPHRDGTGANG
jgi:FkbM family methyltransferase